MADGARGLVAGARDRLWALTTSGRSPRGTPLPPRALRDPALASGEDYAGSACTQVDRLLDHGLAPGTTLLDWGCGAGWLATGLVERRVDAGGLVGVDDRAAGVRWAERHLAAVGAAWKVLDDHLRVPSDDAAFDVVHVRSLFARLGSDDAGRALTELARLLCPGGFAFVVAWTERHVEPETVGPDGVRLSHDRWAELVGTARLRVRRKEHGSEPGGRSLYVLEHA